MTTTVSVSLDHKQKLKKHMALIGKGTYMEMVDELIDDYLSSPLAGLRVRVAQIERRHRDLESKIAMAKLLKAIEKK